AAALDRRDARCLSDRPLRPFPPFLAFPPLLPPVMSLDERKDVVLRHAARDSRSVQLRDVDVMVLRDLPHERRRSLADSVLGGRGGGMRGAGGGFWLDCRRSRRGTFGSAVCLRR